MTNLAKAANNLKRSRWVLLILLILFVSVLLIIEFRHIYTPTNEEIIESILKVNAYTANAEYSIKNSRGEYKEEVSMCYSKEDGMRLRFSNDRIKVYKDNNIYIKDNDCEYDIDRNFDSFYPLGFVQDILGYEIIDIMDGTEDWGELEYLEVDINISSKNKHLSKARLYINKEDKVPILIKIYDADEKERVIITYKEFQYLKEIDKSKII